MFWLKLGVLGSIVLGAFLGYRYVIRLQESNAAQASQIAMQQILIDSKEEEIKFIQDSLDYATMLNETLQDKLQSARVESINAKKVFDEHDFAFLLEKKPGLMSSRMRNGTERVFMAIEAEANR